MTPSPSAMQTLLPIAVEVAILGATLGMAFLINHLIERRHLTSLARREAELSDIAICDLRQVPANWQIESSFLLTGSVVLGSDYFRTWFGNLNNLVGGNIAGYERLIDLATREARLRLLEQARAHDAQAVWCVRIETSTVVGSRRVAGIEAFACGTALRLKR